ncbi:MAG: hypothetical protein Q4A98_00790 [Comamonadaceae bacterium]|nr:hypothetical protein [Comamonadaceae bacterium]
MVPTRTRKEEGMETTDRESVEISKMVAETRKLVQEALKLQGEAAKLYEERLKLEAERNKMQIEALKIERERWWYPVMVAATIIGATLAFAKLVLS